MFFNLVTITRIYGRVPDKPDKRDLYYQAVRATGTLPRSVDLRENCSEIRDQGRLGSCCAFACCGLLEHYANVNRGKVKIFSPMFVYYILRQAQGTVRQDSGGTIRGVLKAVAKKGACKESLWTYPKNALAQYGKFLLKPNDSAYSNAQKHKILTYSRLRTLDEVRGCLADGFPVVCGIDVYESFESDIANNTGEIPLPEKGEELLGGHAIGIFGYREDGCFICRNSWGKSWGDAGYFYLKPEFLQEYGSDFWTVKVTEN